jgi:hypothetical protein
MRLTPIFVACALLVATSAAAQQPDPKALLDAQREAMKALSFMDGVWRGPAWSITQNGRHDITQTERMGPMLDGTLKVLEGRGYEPDGKLEFNAFGIISFNPRTKAYSMRSWAQGNVGDFPFKPTPNGYVWEIPAGPNAIIRYTAVVKGDDYREIGEQIVGGGPPTQIFEMNLKRVGATKWPSGDPIPPK